MIVSNKMLNINNQISRKFEVGKKVYNAKHKYD